MENNRRTRWMIYAKAKGMKKSDFMPPLDTFTAKFLPESKPMIFWSPPFRVLLLSVLFGGFLAAMLFFPYWNMTGADRSKAIVICLVAGFAFGFWRSYQLGRTRARFELKNWDEI